jgi:hypothetical protein
MLAAVADEDTVDASDNKSLTRSVDNLIVS